MSSHTYFFGGVILNEFIKIKSKDELFFQLNIPKKHMTYLLYNQKKGGTENSYHKFEIDKKSGGTRLILAPNRELKAVQKKLAALLWKTQEKIWEKENIHPNISHGFQKKKSIITNASVHRNKKIVLNIDLENFFESFHFGRVLGFFEKNRDFKVPREVALVISQLVCYEGSLPQGAPTSPVITNLICRILDIRLVNIARKFKLDYSRYADDLTFSTNDKSFFDCKNQFLLLLEKEIIRAGFKVNSSKTRLQLSSSRQEVTGLVVNKKISVPKEFYKNTRAMAHRLYKHGEFLINEDVGSLEQLEGRFAFINQIDKYNNGLENNGSLNKNSINHQKYLLKTKLKDNNHYNMLLQLNAREREYQKFLFYKYFYGNTRPTIVTEGKTDSRYLKAALKNLYKDYPKLIEKKNDRYYFKVLFFKKSKKKEKKRVSRYRYFFNLPLDGADSMKNLYNFFSDKSSGAYPNYLNYFKSISSTNPINPTFFIFDNECLDKKKPLRNFINYVYKDNEGSKKLETVKKELHLNITDNLYVITNQLISGKKESEIEDLFDSVTLAHEIDGKKFSKNDDGSSRCRYGKEIFSKYVLENYKHINFENFRPLLDKINDIMSDFNNTSGL